MINRRNALLGIGASVLCGFYSSVGAVAQDSQAPSGTSSQDIDERVRKELAPHEYSEEGIPVFLACEDLTITKPALTPLNATVASEMRRTAESMSHIKPDVAAGDVSKLIEIVAGRDFKNGGTAPKGEKSDPTFLSNAYTLADVFANNPLIRAVNFHNTSRAEAELYERQLSQYSQHFSAVTFNDLDRYLTTGEWHKPKPGLIISVFEGYRNSYEVLTPLIEKYGFVGWFWIITSFINSPIADQLNFAEHHDIDMLTHEYPDGRYAMTWEELRQLDKKHVIASHTRSHTLLSALDPSVQKQEVIGSQEDFQKNLGHPVRAFVSLTGPAYGENAAIDRLIDQAGYDSVLSNFRIQRIKTHLVAGAKKR